MVFTTAAMRWVMSRGMIVGMVAAGVPRVTAAGIAGMIAPGLARMIAPGLTRMIAPGLTRMVADRSRMIRTRCPEPTGRSCHRSRSIPAL